jgi:hypothetical protein
MSSTEIGHVDITEFLFDIEERKDLFSWTVDGVRVWDHIRFSLHRKILREARDQSASITHDSYRDFAKGGYLWARNFLVNNPMLGDCRVLGFGTGRRKQLEDGYWWDLYFDPLYENTDFEYLHIELPHANAHLTPAKTDNLRYIELIQYTGAICYKLGLRSATLSQRDRSLIHDIEVEIEDEFDLSVELTGLIEQKVVKLKIKKPLFDLLLHWLDPEIALLTCSYGQETFVKSCKQNGVPVVELQHGAIDPHHPGYSFPGDRSKSLFPDYLFVWGTFWKKNIEYPIPDDRVVSVGFPHQEEQANKYRSVKSQDQIVFISQPSVGEEISKFAVELAADDRITSKIVYKVHPKRYDDWQEVYPWLAAADIDIIASDSPPLYEILAKSRALVGISSTAIYEALHFGPEIYLLNVPSVAMMEWLSHLSHVRIIDSMDDLVENDSVDTTEVDTQLFFTDNAIERMKEGIERIAGTGYRVGQ